MSQQYRTKHWRISNVFWIALMAVGLGGCDLGSAPQVSQDVSVAPVRFGQGEAAMPTNVKRAQLEAEIMRFADRFAGRMATEMFRIHELDTSRDLRWLTTGWIVKSRTAVVIIAVGPNAVENMLDMVVLTSLTRHSVETYWVPEFFGEEVGQGLVEAARILDEDIWAIAGEVLTPEQQADLRLLIAEWIEKNPNELNFWEVRFDGFSGQRAAELEKVEQTGGLLGEVAQTRQTAEQIQMFGERVLYYMQRAPTITRQEAQFAVLDLIRQPEFAGLFESTSRLTLAADRFASVAETLPEQQFAAISQLMDRVDEQRVAALGQFSAELTQQREAFLDDLLAEEKRVRGILAELRTTIEAGVELAGSINSTVVTVDALATKLDLGNGAPPAKPFNIDDYKQLVGDASLTVREMKELVNSTDQFLLSPGWEQRVPMAQAIFEQVDQQMDRLVYQIFALQAAFIVLLFLLLLGYRYVLSRLHISRS
jgi:hypothetical protein